METTNIISLLALVVTLLVALANFASAKKNRDTSKELERLKKSYDFLSIKYNKLAELKERLAEKRSSTSVADILQTAARGERIKDKVIALKNDTEEAARYCIHLLQTHSHLFGKPVRNEIAEKASHISNFEINFVERIRSANEGDQQEMLSMLRDHVEFHSEMIVYTVELVEAELTAIVDEHSASA